MLYRYERDYFQVDQVIEIKKIERCMKTETQENTVEIHRAV
jgi:hypothetical protein